MSQEEVENSQEVETMTTMEAIKTTTGQTTKIKTMIETMETTMTLEKVATMTTTRATAAADMKMIEGGTTTMTVSTEIGTGTILEMTDIVMTMNISRNMIVEKMIMAINQRRSKKKGRRERKNHLSRCFTRG